MKNKPKKISIAVIFGGVSGEHEVSLCSASSVISALNSNKYKILPIYIDKKGRWTLEKGFPSKEGISLPVRLSVTPGKSALLDQKTGRKVTSIDVIFPLVHGTYGEDGSMQGLFEISDIAYCGCGVLSSAICMDKAIQKRLWRDSGLPIVPWVDFLITEWNWDKKTIIKEAKRLKYPLFVKPANMGSSVGISRVTESKNLEKAIREAFKHDTKVVVEKAVVKAREFELAVIGPTDNPDISVPGEIIPSGEFYDYEAKYIDGESKIIIPAPIDPDLAITLQDIATVAYQTVGASGLARIDFLMAKNGNIYLNEINSLPGSTNMSMFPDLWKASGLAFSRVLDKIITQGIKQHKAKSRLQRDYSEQRSKMKKKESVRL